MDTPPAPRSRRWRLAFALSTLLVFAGGVFVGVQYAGWKSDSSAEPKVAEPKVSARVYMARNPMRTPGAYLFPETPAETAEDFEAFRQKQREIIRSRGVATAALRPPAVANLPIVRSQADPVEWLQGALRVDFVTAEVMRVGLDGDDTEGLQVVLQAVVDAYLERVANREGTERAERLRRLNEYIADWGAMLKRKRQAVAQLRNAGLRRDTPDAIAQNLLDCRRELRRIRLALAAEGSPKEGAPDAATDKLRKQLEFLLSEERQLVAQAQISDETLPLNAEIITLESLLQTVLLKALTLKANQDAPARVQLMEEATVRGKR